MLKFILKKMARNDAMASSIRMTAEHGSIHATFEK